MSILDQAVAFAVEKHSGKLRKIANTPYILHPIEVLTIVGTMTKDEEIMAAAVLHDTVEDTDTTLEEIEIKFGKRVASIVAAETEDKMRDLSPAATWRLRKEQSIEILKKSDDIGVKMVWLGDKLSNMRSFYREKNKGVDIFSLLNQKDPKQHKWYYVLIAEYLKELECYPAYMEYVNLTEKVFEGV